MYVYFFHHTSRSVAIELIVALCRHTDVSSVRCGASIRHTRTHLIDRFESKLSNNWF